jgi:hypothetical protein
MEIIDIAGNIRLWATGSTTLRFDTSGLVNPSTYRPVEDAGGVSWTLVAGDRFTLTLEQDGESGSVFWFRFSEANATALGVNVHSYQLLADFGNGPVVMGSGKISTVRF